jgi:DNA-binding MarR family transcriptional regulator/GNAT superfamily N-acetyltransferase
MNSAIDKVRSFNRVVTLSSGALDDSYLGRGRSLGQARILLEIGPQGADLRSLRERLRLDSGYLSRMLRALERSGLVKTKPGATDRRRRDVALTPKGSAEWTAYDTLSDDLARSLLAPLNASQRERLLAAMGEVEQLMRAASVTIEVEDAESTDAKSCVAAYFAELDRRFEDGFDPGSGGYASSKAGEERSVFLLARLEERPVGCGAVKARDDDAAEIKRMWVAPQARGLGIARRILDRLEDEARALGCRRVRLDTNRSLAEAQAMYRKAGYRETTRYNDNSYADYWFEKDV